MEKNETIREQIEFLSKKYPGLDKIEIQYYGGGDSFDSMYSNTNGVNESDYEDLVWQLIEKTQADFNNDGSKGDILIDLKNKTANIKNYHIVQSEELSDDLTF